MPYQSSESDPHSNTHTHTHSNSLINTTTNTTNTTTPPYTLIQHNKENTQDDTYIPQTPCTPINTSSHRTPLSPLNTDTYTPCTPINTSLHLTPLSQLNIPQTPCTVINTSLHPTPLNTPQTPCTAINTSSYRTPLSQLSTPSPISPQPEYIQSLTDIDRTFLSPGDHQPLNRAIPFAKNLHHERRPCRLGIRGDGSCALGALLRVIRPDIAQTVENVESYRAELMIV